MDQSFFLGYKLVIRQHESFTTKNLYTYLLITIRFNLVSRASQNSDGIPLTLIKQRFLNNKNLLRIIPSLILSILSTDTNVKHLKVDLNLPKKMRLSKSEKISLPVRSESGDFVIKFSILGNESLMKINDFKYILHNSKVWISGKSRLSYLEMSKLVSLSIKVFTLVWLRLTLINDPHTISSFNTDLGKGITLYVSWWNVKLQLLMWFALLTHFHNSSS